MAARLDTTDQVHHGLTFGPAKTTTHEVDVQLELVTAARP
jgi:hypothetical protein